MTWQKDKKFSPGKDGSAVNTLRIVERVGRRFLIACGCGNYFLSGPEMAVCDHCGAEAAVSKLSAGRRYGHGAP